MSELFNGTQELNLANGKLAFVQELAREAEQDPDLWRIEVYTTYTCSVCQGGADHLGRCDYGCKGEAEASGYWWFVRHEYYGYNKPNPKDGRKSYDEFVKMAEKSWQNRPAA